MTGPRDPWVAQPLRVRCGTCGTKWYFEERHLARPDIDPTTCSGCGGMLEPLDPEAAGPQRP